MASILLKGGVVIDTDPSPTVLGVSDVLVQDGLIAAVGPDLPGGPGTEVIDASGTFVLPGFVDTHRHTWQAGLRAILPDSTLPVYLEQILYGIAPRFDPRDVHAGVLSGALECLDTGITTLLDWSHIQLTPAHTDANVEALKASGIRSVFGYAYGGRDSLDAMAAEARRVHREHFADDPRSMAIAAFGPEISAERGTAEWRLARELDLPVTAHMGGHGSESAEQGLAILEREGLLSHPATYVHANFYTDDAFKRIAANGGSVSVTPTSETMLNIGYPPTGRARAAGIPTSLSVDTVTTGPGDMFSVMRAAYMFERVRPDEAGMGFTTRDVLRMATIEGAETLGLADITGSLRPGKQADLIMLRADTLGMASAHDPIAAVVLSADTSSVDTVLVGGRIVKRAGRLLHHDLPAVLAAIAESAARVAQ
ncbi:amidohydrolase family protein [Actinomadura rudentiformis]|uniref:Amidohydrolase family protein n=1 Tax=Actinomadura rudentiformis TaxID=359158 RepID=A0A6H9YCI8_9ACTN|nr:amidohydrolase family protein [Actinomadura rudentiformis]KAB2341239.1 amidohydrolase family protein [Actinomadura rudentiformis]